MQRIIQLTDLHLQENPSVLYNGVNPDNNLHLCLNWISLLQKNPDLLLFTGDLSHYASLCTYKRLYKLLQYTNIQHIWLAGNHDNAETIYVATGKEVTSVRRLKLKYWNVLLLDSNHNSCARGSGTLSNSSLMQLEYYLYEETIIPTLVVLHHNAIPVQSHWQNAIMLSNADDFLKILKPHKQIKAILCGHVHQEMDCIKQDHRFLATPATSIQFKENSEHFALQHNTGPGLRILDLLDNGKLQTQVNYIGQLKNKTILNSWY